MFVREFVLNPASELPAYEQLYHFLVAQIKAGVLVAGDRLPSRRRLSAECPISQRTVDTAYGMLVDEGYVETRERSGFYVCPPESVTFGHPDIRRSESSFESRERAEEAGRYRYHFFTNGTDLSLFPYQSWVRLNRESFYASPHLLGAGSALGDEGLCKALCECLWQHRHLDCSPSQVVIGAGFPHTLGVALGLVSGAGRIAVDDPGCPGIYTVVSYLNKKAVPVGVDGEGTLVRDLWDMEVDAAIVAPSCQFPFGSVMSLERRKELIAWANAKDGRFIIEVDSQYEFMEKGASLPNLFSLDTMNKVVYVNSFDHSVSPALAVGYAVLPQELLRLLSGRIAKESSGVSRYTQQSLARLIESGIYTRYLLRARRIYRQRRALLADILREIPGSEILCADSGLQLLFSLPHREERRLVELAEEKRVLVHGLSEYAHAHPVRPGTLVLGYGSMDERALSAAARLLRDAFSD